MTISTITMSDAERIIETCYKANEPLLVLGEPGMGKTALFTAVAKKLGIGYIPNILSQKDPVDVGGMRVPDQETGILKHYVPEDLPVNTPVEKFVKKELRRESRHPDKGILHYDEINVVSMLMQATAYGIINERRVGLHRLKEGWVPMASGNNVTDRSAAQRLSLALANRFNIQQVKPDHTSWLAQFGSANVEPLGCAFIRFRPELFHKMPKDPTEVRFPSARSWTSAFKFINQEPTLRRKLMAGRVGDAAADEFEAFWRIVENAVTFEQIVTEPSKTPVPPQSEPALYYAVVGMLARTVDRKTMDRAMIYVNRMLPDYQVALIQDLTRREPGLKNTAGYADWAVRNQDVTL